LLSALALAVALAAALTAAAPAAAARNLAGVPDNLTESALSDHFWVHYTSAPGDPNAIDPAAAQQLLVTAERVLGDSTTQLGFPAPRDDGDGRIDVYVYRDADASEPGFVRADSRADQTTGWIAVPPGATGDVVTVAHEVFHLMQLAVYRPAGLVLAEGSATWASLHLYAGELRSLPDEAQYFPDDPLDCTDTDRCSRPGYATWQFLELLSERYGPEVVRALYDRSRSLGQGDHRPHVREALDSVLKAENTTLPAAFADFTRANLTGGYALRGLARRRYGATEPFGDLASGTRSRRLRTRAVTLDHLAAAFYRVRSGSDAKRGRTRCRSARLTVTLTGPADLEAPIEWAMFRPRAKPARSVALKKGRATMTLPWSTCAGREVGIALLNPSETIDGRVFAVRAALRLVGR
jgi:hypothetical protein